MSEAVEVIISADDQASKEFANVAKNAERSINQVKTAGGQLKGASAFGAVFAKTLGGSELGSAINQVGEVTEKVNQFGEVAKMGGAGALAFKGGLVALAFAAGTQVGSAISNLIFDFAQYERQIEAAQKKQEEFQAEVVKLSQRRFSGSLADIELIRDPEEKEVAIRELTQSVDKEIAGLTNRVAASQKAVDQWAAAWKITGDRKGFEQQAQAQLKQDEELLRVAKDQRQALIDQAAARERATIAAQNQAAIQREEKAQQAFSSMLQALDEEATLYTQGADAVANYRMEQANLSQESQQTLIAMREKNKELKKEYEERQKVIEKEKQGKATYDATLSSLQKQRIAIDQGAEAARRYELAQQGMTKAMIDNVVAQEKRNAADEKAQQKAEDAKQIVADEKEAMRLRRIEIEKGAEAAKEAALIARGVSEEQAKAIVAESKRLDMMEARKQAAGEVAGPIAARESRMLSGRSAAVENMSKAQLDALVAIENAILDQTKNNRVRLVQVNK